MMKESLGLEITELRLGLPNCVEKKERKRAFSEVEGDKNGSNVVNDDDCKEKTKNQVVGWPPVCSYRRKNSFNGRDDEAKKMYIKVSLDGAPILRKIDLSTHKSYSDLIMALEKLFGCFGIREALEDAENSEYVPIYEDKDGDWMLLGDVPWGMFSESCKKLRIMKRSDAKGMRLQTQDLLKGITKESSL